MTRALDAGSIRAGELDQQRRVAGRHDPRVRSLITCMRAPRAPQQLLVNVVEARRSTSPRPDRRRALSRRPCGRCRRSRDVAGVDARPPEGPSRAASVDSRSASGSVDRNTGRQDHPVGLRERAREIVLEDAAARRGGARLEDRPDAAVRVRRRARRPAFRRPPSDGARNRRSTVTPPRCAAMLEPAA